MKIVVYAISKNEEQFVKRWYESIKEADQICVLDTGSTDNTVKELEKYNIKVEQKIITPWRFDVARNESIKLIDEDTDICVCMDLDEIIKPGWRKELESVWQEDTTRCRYIYNWKMENDKPIISFYQEKIHARHNFKWIHPVHEILEYNGVENYVTTDNIIMNHYPDNNKSRSSYLPLLELSIKENPENDRNLHYLGREYMFYKKYNEAIDTLLKHLKLKNSNWSDERCASMRFIARSYQGLERYDEAILWLDKAIKEAPHLRDPLMEKALLMYKLKNNIECEKLVRKALKIKLNNKTYINEVFTFDHTAYDLLSIIYYDKKDYKKAKYYIKKALKITPKDERLKNNLKHYEKLLEDC